MEESFIYIYIYISISIYLSIYPSYIYIYIYTHISCICIYIIYIYIYKYIYMYRYYWRMITSNTQEYLKEGRLILSHYFVIILLFFSVIVFFFIISFQTLIHKEITRLQSMFYIVNFGFLVWMYYIESEICIAWLLSAVFTAISNKSYLPQLKNLRFPVTLWEEY